MLSSKLIFYQKLCIYQTIQVIQKLRFYEKVPEKVLFFFFFLNKKVRFHEKLKSLFLWKTQNVRFMKNWKIRLYEKVRFQEMVRFYFRFY